MAFPPTLQRRLIRYDELRPCRNAFIDARSPGSDEKENFTIVGPGVAENPAQFVHIREPHGFNIGAARQPPGCTNSLHSHHSEEVFIVHRGIWRFVWGEHGDAGAVVLLPGDTISIPIHVFRGFENVGDDIGFMFAVLGGDDPGRVHWAPHVIVKARGYGLVLLENGSLVDTALGEVVPTNATIVHPSTPSEIAYIRTPSEAEMTRNVVRRTDLMATPNAASASPCVREFAIIEGSRDAAESSSASITRAHGFTLSLLSLEAGATTTLHTCDTAEVLLMHRGRLGWHNDLGEHVELNPGDTFSVPPNMARRITALTAAEVYAVRASADQDTLSRSNQAA